MNKDSPPQALLLRIDSPASSDEGRLKMSGMDKDALIAAADSEEDSSKLGPSMLPLAEDFSPGEYDGK